MTLINRSNQDLAAVNFKSLTLNPVYIAPSAWWQHVPIAHWLVSQLQPDRIVELGTHYGVSFFSFCEAAQAFSPNTFVYAVDTWEGDEHASYYGNDVYAKVESHWQQTHRLRSRLIRSTFDHANDYFEDGSIDILHIDGLHTYEAVKHDYEVWLPKMNTNSIILFHDINVREREFGVWKLWHEVKLTNKTYQILNGHGLGILIIGEEMADRLLQFSALATTFQAKGELLEKMASLTPGGSFGMTPIEHSIAEVEKARTEVEQAKAEVVQAKAAANQARAEVEKARAEAEQSSRQRMEIESSRFWRMTKPARRLLDFIKRCQAGSA